MGRKNQNKTTKQQNSHLCKKRIHWIYLLANVEESNGLGDWLVPRRVLPSFTFHQVSVVYWLNIPPFGAWGEKIWLNFHRTEVLPPQPSFCSLHFSQPHFASFTLKDTILWPNKTEPWFQLQPWDTAAVTATERRAAPSHTVNSIVDQIVAEKKSHLGVFPHFQAVNQQGFWPSWSLLLPFLTVPHFFNTSSSTSSEANLTESSQFFKLSHFKKSVGAHYLAIKPHRREN